MGTSGRSTRPVGPSSGVQLLGTKSSRIPSYELPSDPGFSINDTDLHYGGWTSSGAVLLSLWTDNSSLLIGDLFSVSFSSEWDVRPSVNSSLLSGFSTLPRSLTESRTSISRLLKWKGRRTTGEGSLSVKNYSFSSSET